MTYTPTAGDRILVRRTPGNYTRVGVMTGLVLDVLTIGGVPGVLHFRCEQGGTVYLATNAQMAEIGVTQTVEPLPPTEPATPPARPRKDYRMTEQPARLETPAEIDAHLRTILTEDAYLRFQQTIGEHAIGQTVDDVQMVRAAADNEGLFNNDWREGWDDVTDRIDPDRNGPYPVKLIEFPEEI
jgi:hypothetical protein